MHYYDVKDLNDYAQILGITPTGIAVYDAMDKVKYVLCECECNCGNYWLTTAQDVPLQRGGGKGVYLPSSRRCLIFFFAF